MFFFKQKTAYEMRISDWSSDVCSSDLLFGARNRGATGTDLNTIPVLAIEQVEVLRDGAAAQYGSDAIAGVMNITLKQRLGCEGVLAYGQYSRGDGENALTTAYCGVERSEERRGGNACVSQCRSRWSPDH